MFKPLASVVWGLVLTLGLPIAHAPAQDLQKLKVAEVVRSQLFAPMYVAINRSFFRDQGIELDLITANGGDRVGALVLSGQVDLGLAGPEVAIYLYNSESPDKPVMFCSVNGTDGFFFVSREKIEPFAWDKLKNRRIIGWRPNYEAFALMIGLRLLQLKWPQSFPVAVLRRLRPELEREHARILKQDPKILFDQKRIRENARPGDLYVDNTDPVFLTIVSREAHLREGPTGTLPCAVCHGREQMFKFVKEQSARSSSSTELATLAHALSLQLSKVQPRKRGRSS